ncbi:MAG: FecR family protein [Acidobacteriia bacterium]|nr:FecR family protein [Terriglobia bacterium]
MSMLRNALCWMMIAVFPLSLMAADSGAAMLYAKGPAWINGSTVPRSSAIFPGDLVQTRTDSVANINATGSSVMVLSDSLVKFEGNAVSVEHGSVSVATSKGMMTRAGEVTVAPATGAWTEFEVTDVDGTVQIVARKGDVSISDGSGTSSTLPQGEETTRDESQAHKKDKRKGAGAAPAAAPGVLNSPYAIALGAAAVGGLLTWVLIQGDEPMSNSIP